MFKELLLLLSLISLGRSQFSSVDYRLLRRSALPSKINPCKTPGLSCLSCEDVQMCIHLGDNTYDATHVQTCDSATQWCLNGACVNKTTSNPFCEDGYNVFKCPQPGLFPDPLDCQAYHICCPKTEAESSTESPGSESVTGNEGDKNGSGGGSGVEARATGNVQPEFESKSLFCDSGYGYNAKTTFCDKKLVNGVCPLTYPIPLCKTAGQNGPVPENQSMYYICVIDRTTKVLRPELKVCKNGKLYKPTAGCQ